MELLARIQKEKTNFGKQGSALRVRQVLGACQFCPDVRVTVRFSSQEAGPHVHTISPLSLLSLTLSLCVSISIEYVSADKYGPFERPCGVLYK